MNHIVLIICLLIVSLGTWAQKNTLRINLAAKEPVSAEEEKQKQLALERSLEKILSNIKKAQGHFEYEIDYVDKKPNEKSETYLDINSFKFNSLVQFNEDMEFSLDGKETKETQAKKVIPVIKLNSKNMFLVSKINVGNMSELTLRLCHNYTLGNDFCDTSNDNKLLEVNMENISFKKFISLRIKQITITMTKKTEGKFDSYEFNGICDSYQKGFDDLNGVEKYLPMECSFKGLISNNPKVGTQVKMIYKDKK